MACVYVGQQNFPMKKNLLLLASLAVLASSASVAQSPPELVVLPTYVVQAPRYQPSEQQVKANLDALRSQAGFPGGLLPSHPPPQGPGPPPGPSRPPPP